MRTPVPRWVKCSNSRPIAVVSRDVEPASIPVAFREAPFRPYGQLCQVEHQVVGPQAGDVVRGVEAGERIVKVVGEKIRSSRLLASTCSQSGADILAAARS